ncbi:MAG: TonB-dependent receptor [Flavobacterium sp. MedPE-SWcel]|uniref:outer membrane beta-barrel family protein n=1 Tax=uncultured Flavobacterium sp. TaxID=165435 RepID=UPI0009179776|nr:outer membrane beta-barrel family protein [uncultured Flavobacterium sp.]OIQ20136.1 MAG: TonB-dependent receptor [Flavobacterium sp. MedPE-SWcel]
MKRIYPAIVLCFLLSSITAFAQGKSNKNIGKIRVTGKVIEQDTKQPLEFATVTIQTTANETINGGLTNAKGEYDINVPVGTYNIKFDFISFKSISITNKEIKSNINLGTTAMEPDATILNEVEIVAERSTVDIKLDKRVYNVGKDMIVKGGSVSDVLDNVPSISVDVEGNVSLRGNESVTILIDGRPSTLAGSNVAEVLRVLPADSVKKVEVITNPSARYDAEGGGGIINIVLRKGKANGFNGSIVASTGYPDNHGITANLNYRSDSYNLFSNIGYNYRSSPGNFSTDSEYFDEEGNTTRFVNERRDYERKRNGLNASFGMDLFLNKSTTWTNSFSIRNNKSDNPTDTYYDYYLADRTFDETRYRFNLEDRERDNYRFSSRLTKKFNEDGHKLDLDISLAKNENEENANIDDIVIGTTTPDTDNVYQRTFNDEDEDRVLLQADYVLPFSEGNQFEAGYRGSFTDLLTDSKTQNLESNTWVIDPNFTSILDYKEHVNAVYAQYGFKTGKFSFLMGLRWEDSNIDVNLLNDNNYNNKRYNNFFPSAFVTYEFSEGTSANISYSRRINRPRGWFINPFSSLSSNINIFTGNPNLDPSMTDAIDLGFLKKWDQVTLSGSAYVNITNDTFQFVRRESGEFFTQVVDGEDIVNDNNEVIEIIGGEDVRTPIILTSPINLAKQYRYGFEFDVNYTPYRWWKLNSNFNFYRNEIDGDYVYTNFLGEVITQNFDNTNYSWFTRLNSKVNFPLGIDWQLNSRYSGPRKNAQSSYKGIFSANTAISKDILNERATLSLNVSDIFNSRKRKLDNTLPQVNSYTEMQWRERQITLSFTYRFNTKKNDRGRGNQQGGGDDGYMGK